MQLETFKLIIHVSCKIFFSRSTSIQLSASNSFEKQSRAHVFRLFTITSNLKSITDNHCTHDLYQRHVLEALLSGPNTIFTTYIQRIKHDIEGGFGVYARASTDYIIITARTKYNNMVETDECNKKIFFYFTKS